MTRASAALLLLPVLCSCAHHSLKDVLLKLNEDDLPRPNVVVLPPVSDTKIGSSPNERLTDEQIEKERALSDISDNPCFLPLDTNKADDPLVFEERKITYKDAGVLTLELGAILKGFKLAVGNNGSATLLLTNARRRANRFTPPRLDSNCFSDLKKVHRVFTSEIYAEKVTLKDRTDFTVTAELPSANAKVEAKGWGADPSDGNNLFTKGAVLFAKLSRVQLAVTPDNHKLGLKPSPQLIEKDKFDPLPVTIDSLNRAAGVLRVDLNPNALVKVRAINCAFDAKGRIELQRGRRCELWPYPGPNLVTLTWNYGGCGDLKGSDKEVFFCRTLYQTLPK